jgi:hypothetical protein
MCRLLRNSQPFIKFLWSNCCIEWYENRTEMYKSRALIRLRLSGMGRRAVWYVGINVSKDPGPSVFYPEDGGCIFHRNVSAVSTKYTASPLWEPQFQNYEVLCYVIVSVTHCALGWITGVSNSEWRLENSSACSVWLLKALWSLYVPPG